MEEELDALCLGNPLFGCELDEVGAKEGMLIAGTLGCSSFETAPAGWCRGGVVYFVFNGQVQVRTLSSQSLPDLQLGAHTVDDFIGELGGGETSAQVGGGPPGMNCFEDGFVDGA